MNKKTLSIAIILTGLVGMLTFACEEKDSVHPASEKVQSSVEEAPEITISVERQGMLERSDSGGLVLVNDQNHYDLRCDSDLNDLVGKQIKVTGTLKTKGSVSFIQVAQAFEDPASLTEQRDFNTEETNHEI